MKPDRIIILRHGESVANVDKKLYTSTPDYAMQLTSLGRKQASAAGQQIRAMLEAGTSVQFYASPFWRTRQTYEQVATALSKHKQQYYEDPRLREQEWSGDFREDAQNYASIEQRRDTYGHFYYRLHGGESCADVFDRVSDFIGTMHRDFEKSDFPRNVVLVTHGMTMRVFLMRWFHMKVEQFERLANPVNCEMYVLKSRMIDDHYDLLTQPRLHRVRHKFQYPLK